jgi:hypothetical protein
MASSSSALPQIRACMAPAEVQQHLNDIIGKTPDSSDTMLFNKEVSWADGGQRANWAHTFADVDSRGLFSDWLKAGMGGKEHRAGLFTTMETGWVGKVGWPEISDWEAHAWLGFLVGTAGKKGKILAIWDSNGKVRLEGRGDFNGRMCAGAHKLYRFLVDKKKMKISGVMVGGSGNTEEGICLKLSLEKLRELMVAEGDLVEKLEKEGFSRIR